MKNYILYTISFSLLLIAAADGICAGTSCVENFPSFSCGFGSCSSASYGNISNMGSAVSDNSSSLSFRSYSGYLPSQVVIPTLFVIPDPNIVFIDQSPVSDSFQPTVNVTSRVTVQNSGGNKIWLVEYRVSKSGPADSNFGPWRLDASTDTVIDATRTSFKISIPNAAGDSFAEGTNNYIQWLVINDAGAQSQSGAFRVSVSTNDAPSIVITQPDVKSDFTSLSPMLAATISDQFGGVDPAAIQIKIDDAVGANIITVNSSANTSIYDPVKNTLSYKYSGPALTVNASYNLTISATDKLGKASSASRQFVPKTGQIADLIPYPSPFDPKKQPVILRYVLDKRSDVWIYIFDMGGRIVKTVAEAQGRGPGLCEDQWSGTNFGGEELANGVYFCEIKIKNDDGEFKRYASLAIYGK